MHAAPSSPFLNSCRYKQCIEDTLEKSGQDCSGVCTPARRFHKMMTFNYDLDCTLRKAPDSRCNIIVSFFCFDEVKVSKQHNERDCGCVVRSLATGAEATRNDMPCTLVTSLPVQVGSPTATCNYWLRGNLHLFANK